MSWISKIEPLSTKNMRYFVTVVECGSINRAAPVLNMSPAVLRSRIQALAARLGRELFARTDKGLALTVAGQEVYRVCKESLESFERVRQDIHVLRDAGPIAGRVRFGIHPALAQTIVPAVLTPLLEAHQQIEIEAFEAESATQMGWLEEGRIDIAIGVPDVSHWWLSKLAEMTERLVICRRRQCDHAVADIADLQNMNVVWNDLSASVVPPAPASSVASGDHGGTRPQLKMNGFIAAIAFVRSSDWCSVVPLSAVIREVEAGELVAYPMRPAKVERLMVAQHTDRALNSAGKAFLSALWVELGRLSKRSDAYIAKFGSMYDGGV